MKKSIILLLLCATFSFSQNIKLKTGDLIFQSMNCGELCDAINQVTEGYKGIDFNHMEMVVIENNSVFVLEASENSVKLTPYQTFISYTDLPMYVGRVKKRFKKLRH